MKSVNKVWACEKNFLQGYLDAHAKVNASDISKEQIKAFIGNDEKVRLPSILDVKGKEAFINISGPLSKSGPDFCDVLMGFGGTSYLEIIEAAKLLIDADDIEKVTLKMDTPGGAVNGVDETFQAILVLASKKEVIAENHGMIASAGYWIASAATKIVSVAPTTETGSIGVIFSTYDDSEALKKAGIKEIIIVSQNAPNKHTDVSTKEGIKLLTDRANAAEEVFIARVASGRKVSEEKVIKDFGKGGVLISSKAIEVGLIDGLIGMDLQGNSPDVTIDSQDKVNLESNNDDAAAVAGQEQKDGGLMTLKEMLAQNPAMAEEVEKIKTEAFVSGEKAKQEEINKSIDDAGKFLGSEYPKPIMDLAVEVIKGKTPLVALTTAASTHDAIKASNEEKDAQKETKDLGDTPPESKEKKVSTGKLENEKDEQAAINNLKLNS